MKKYLPLALTVFLFSSCGTYQMMTVNSPSVTRDEKSGALFTENDSLKITYTFNGADNPVGIEVRNKLDKPLYIDWQRSALIYKDSAISFTGNRVAINLATSGLNYNRFQNNVNAYSYSNTSGEAALPQRTEFIPPHAFIKRSPVRMPNALVTDVSDTAFHKIKMASINEGEVVRADRALFSPNNSPVTFSSYITFYTEENKEKAIVYKQDFYVSEVYKTKRHPAQTTYYSNAGGDKFYSFQANN